MLFGAKKYAGTLRLRLKLRQEPEVPAPPGYLLLRDKWDRGKNVLTQSTPGVRIHANLHFYISIVFSANPR